MSKKINARAQALAAWRGQLHGLEESTGITTEELATVLLHGFQQQYSRKAPTLANAIHFACTYYALATIVEEAKKGRAATLLADQQKVAAEIAKRDPEIAPAVPPLTEEEQANVRRAAGVPELAVDEDDGGALDMVEDEEDDDELVADPELR